MKPMKKTLCHCGKELHYSSGATERFVKDMVKTLGEYIEITIIEGETYKVQRHYLALHGIKAHELDQLGFEKIKNEN